MEDIKTEKLEIEELVCEDNLVEVTPVSGFSSPETSTLNGVNSSFFTSILNLPKCLRGMNIGSCGASSVNLEVLELSIQNFQIPDATISSNVITHNHGDFKDSSQKLEASPDISFRIRLDDNMVNYNTMYQWMNMIRNFETGVGDERKFNYATTFSVFTLDGYQCPIGAHTFHNIFPTTIGGYDLDSSSGDDVYFEATFSYDYFLFELNEEFGTLTENNR